MRATTDLVKLHGALANRLLRLRRRFGTLIERPLGDRSLVIANVIIELDNLILSTLREFMISSLRGARTASGVRVKTNRSFGPEDEISAYVLSVLNDVRFKNLKRPNRVSRREEPTIRDPRCLWKVFIDCNATNVPSLENALALNLALFRDLGTFRNFYAHRNADTWRKAKARAESLGALNVKHPDQVIQAQLNSRPVSLFEDWLDDAELFFEEITR